MGEETDMKNRFKNTMNDRAKSTVTHTSKPVLKSALSCLLASSLLLSCLLIGTACRKKSRHYTVDNITLGEDRTFRNDDPKYEELRNTLMIDR